MSRLVEGVLAPVRWFEALTTRTQDRLVGLALSLPSGIVLAIAGLLTPDPSGLGTHRQLGLGGCAMLTGTGVPCPMCGMTTTFTHLAHLQPVQGALNQPFGVVLFACTVAAFAVGLSDLAVPRGRWRRALGLVDRHEGKIAGGLLLGLVLGWLYKIAVVREILSGLG